MIGWTLSASLFIFVVLSSVAGDEVCVELIARFQTTSATDGVEKEIITVNGEFPGPTIRAKLGDTLKVKVINQLKDSKGETHSTSVHFHGIEMKQTPWMDGPEQVAQCPIKYNSSYVYEFMLVQKGTYWYHSHHSWQYIDGFWGFLIVDNATRTDNGGRMLSEVYQYDDELTISLMDWHWRTGPVLTDLYNLPRSSSRFDAGRTPLPDSALINGFGNANCRNATSSYPGHVRRCDPKVADTVTMMNVVRGRTYRVRVLNPSARANFNFSIQGHTLSVIEMDGVDTKRVDNVNAVTIWAAQRYSFLVTMNNLKAGETAKIFAPMMIDDPEPERTQRRLQPIQPLAFLKYMEPKASGSRPPGRPGVPASSGSTSVQDRIERERVQSDGKGTQGRPNDNMLPANDPMIVAFASAPTSAKCTQMPLKNTVDKCQTREPKFQVRDARPPRVDFDQSSATPLMWRGNQLVMDAPPPFDNKAVVKYLNATNEMDSEGHGFSRWLFNKVSYSTRENYKPAFFVAREKKQLRREFVAQEIPPLRTIQVIINNAAGAHPYHLHGHTFWVMGTGKENDGPYNPRVHKLDERQAIRRDTTHVLDNSWAVVRFYSNNPGVWLLHCHIHWHFEHGLAAVFVEGEQHLPAYKVPSGPKLMCRENDVLLRTPDGKIDV